jgi:polyisoprenoid-binding protein YceI
VTSTDSSSPGLSPFEGTWSIDPQQSKAEFRTKALWVLPVKGTVKVIGGGATVGSDGSLTGSLIIDVASIDTKNKKRDSHLRTTDFFEVIKYPTITFDVTNGRIVDSSEIILEGSLTVHGQTKSLVISARVDSSGESVILTTEVDIDRRSWGMSLSPFGARFKNRVGVKATFRRS